MAKKLLRTPGCTDGGVGRGNGRWGALGGTGGRGRRELMHRGALARETFEESQAVGAQLGGPPLADVDGRMEGCTAPRGLSQAESADCQAGTLPAFKARREL